MNLAFFQCFSVDSYSCNSSQVPFAIWKNVLFTVNAYREHSHHSKFSFICMVLTCLFLHPSVPRSISNEPPAKAHVQFWRCSVSQKSSATSPMFLSLLPPALSPAPFSSSHRITHLVLSLLSWWWYSDNWLSVFQSSYILHAFTRAYHVSGLFWGWRITMNKICSALADHTPRQRPSRGLLATNQPRTIFQA